MAAAEATIGRIVLYRPALPVAADWPAIVSAVGANDEVSLTAFPPGGAPRAFTRVPVFESYSLPDPRPGAVLQQAPVEPGTWRWPERV